MSHGMLKNDGIKSWMETSLFRAICHGRLIQELGQLFSLSCIFANENPSKKGLSPAGKISGSNRETDRLHNFGGNAINHQRPWFLKRKKVEITLRPLFSDALGFLPQG